MEVHFAKYKVIVLVLMVSGFLSCIKENSSVESIEPRYYQVELKDQLLKQTIGDYSNENKIDKRRNFIYLTIKRSAIRTTYYLNHSANSFKDISTTPSYYAILDSALVLVYGGIEGRISNPKVLTELYNVVKEEGIQLSEEIILEHYPVWQISNCDSTITKKIDNYFEDDIPCGFEIVYKNRKPFLQSVAE